MLYPAINMAVCRIPSRTTATIYTVRVLPEIGAAFCSCDGFRFRKTCRHCREALAQFEAPQTREMTPAEVAADATLAPFDEEELLIDICGCGLPTLYAPNEVAWCEECALPIHRVKAKPPFELERLRRERAAAALVTPRECAESAANEAEMVRQAVALVGLMEKRPVEVYADYFQGVSL